MSLGCYECERGGAFDALIIFDPDGVFDEERTTSSFPNFYTCCAAAGDFTEAVSSRLAIVVHREKQDSWCTGDDGPTLEQVTWKRIHEEEVARLLPRTHRALVKSRAA